MKMITIAHPGRYGDLLWALPTMRFLSEAHGNAGVRLLLPTDPANTTPMQGIAELLRVSTDYLAEVQIVPEWSITQDAPRMPLSPPGPVLFQIADGADMDLVQLGYISWPTHVLPYETAALAGVLDHFLGPEHDAHVFRPWLKVHRIDVSTNSRPRVAVHWTDRYFELKLGILHELRRNLPEVGIDWYAGPGSRMAEAGAVETEFLALARCLSAYDVVLTDCSSAHVLATALGVKRVLVVEPEEARHHWVFWPGSTLHDDGVAKRWYQKDTVLGRTVFPVLGGDHRPTFDSRHTADAVKEALHAVRR